jgi:hypothetical protein
LTDFAKSSFSEIKLEANGVQRILRSQNGDTVAVIDRGSAEMIIQGSLTGWKIINY